MKTAAMIAFAALVFSNPGMSLKRGELLMGSAG